MVAMGLWNLENFWVENLAIIKATNIAIDKGWNSLWIELDYKSAVSNFNTNKLPWRLQARWLRCKMTLNSVVVSHI